MALIKVIATYGLTKISRDPKVMVRVLNSLDLHLPNTKTSTIGGKIFWYTIANVDGWKLQENLIFGNCRILDPQNSSKAWGGKKEIRKAFEELY